ncbi:hypothetical protein Amme_089_004 [Acidomonas methanolica NBRC 104435]|uniref:Uncharacterized protein n=1 Tax=Acidomonas methanolica NBRC 104435 TaxID=1231351 RepID=A0A023D739_ACIMT|nr:hypothetical protein Amme_089_004 [Acidomonas methanolica NBRC 104435]GEL00672.1 hypothetical protein AME01nite_31700 [Acidomonas methanolica NBRC 104435]
MEFDIVVEEDENFTIGLPCRNVVDDGIVEVMIMMQQAIGQRAISQRILAVAGRIACDNDYIQQIAVGLRCAVQAFEQGREVCSPKSCRNDDGDTCLGNRFERPRWKNGCYSRRGKLPRRRSWQMTQAERDMHDFARR